ncbi:DUF2585 family protein [Amaricoccus sp.]|uniref:DUF2585 family protein n=1 Tax=Amaricoccus sp. TaxID=1872485 RepID=UPI001B5FC1DF|nr:DUF2585 family protein [Amaricoccus sp.]MBP7242702.1 DUF2585 family protein [Amaricoccus sp.]
MRRTGGDARWLLIAAALVAAQAVALRLMGQPWICDCGVVKLWGAAGTSDNSQHLADWYTLSHVVHGFLFWGALWLALPRRIGFAPRLAVAVAVEAAWELFENTDFVINRYREATISLDYFGDSVINSVSDTLFMGLGFLLASRLPWKASVAVVLALELVAAVAIRDNLTLNILMLIAPSEAVKAWQAGG